MATNVSPPFMSFNDANGKPLEGGKIYIGEAGQNAETNPLPVYWDQAGTIPAAQPITTSGGYPWRSGSTANIFVGSSYSIIVKDKNGVLVFTSPINQVSEGINAIFYGWKNYVSNSSFEDGGSTGWNLGKDTGTTVPLSGGIGGGTSSFLPLSIERTAPLAGSSSLLINKPASNCQGSTVYSNNMTIDREDVSSAMELTFTFQTPVGDYATDDYKVFLWDVTGGSLVTLSTNSLPTTLGVPGRFTATLTSTSNLVYRIVIMCVNSSNLNAFSIMIDSILFRPAVSITNALTLGGTTLANLQKGSADYLYEAGSIHPKLSYKAPSVWNAGSPYSYFPALDLSAITGSQTIDSSGVSSGLTLSPITKLVSAPFVTWARAQKLTLREGMGATAKSDFTLSTYSLTSNVVTLTFAVDTDLTAMINMLIEWGLVEGASANLLTYTADYTKGPVINIPTALGAIPANDYVVTGYNSAARTVTFAYTNANIGSTASSVQCAFYPYRIPGSTTTARVTAVQGRALVGANDGLLENVAHGKRRGRFQGHRHLPLAGTAFDENVGSGGELGGVGTVIETTSVTTGNPTTDTVNGTTRTGPETDVRNLAVHFYIGLGGLDT